MISIEDLKKVDLRVAKIIDVEDHPNADRLCVLQLDVGEDTNKQIVAGIKQHYTKEDLLNKNIIVVYNLQPVILRGVESNGMLLAAKDEDVLGLTTVDKAIRPGTRLS